MQRLQWSLNQPFLETQKRFQWLPILFWKVNLPLLVMTNYLIRKVFISTAKNSPWNKPEDSCPFSVRCDLMIFSQRPNWYHYSYSVVVSSTNIPAEIFGTNVAQGGGVSTWSVGLIKYTKYSDFVCLVCRSWQNYIPCIPWAVVISCWEPNLY